MAEESMINVQVCFFLLDESPWVGMFRKDADGYGYCDNQLVAEPDGHPILNINEYRLATIRVPLKPDGSYDRPEIVGRLAEAMIEISNDYETDWDAQTELSIAVWESTFGRTERHAW